MHTWIFVRFLDEIKDSEVAAINPCAKEETRKVFIVTRNDKKDFNDIITNVFFGRIVA